MSLWNKLKTTPNSELTKIGTISLQSIGTINIKEEKLANEMANNHKNDNLIK